MATCVIAASAERHGLGVLHADRDYDAIARVVPLQVSRGTSRGAIVTR